MQTGNRMQGKASDQRGQQSALSLCLRLLCLSNACVGPAPSIKITTYQQASRRYLWEAGDESEKHFHGG